MDILDPRRPETFLAICSGWGALQMWFWPGEFDATNAPITTSVGLHGHEQCWAIFGFLAATVKIIGLICRLQARWTGFSEGLVAAGLFLSVIFWMIVGISTLADFPHSIMPAGMIACAIAAAWQLAEWRRAPEQQE